MERLAKLLYFGIIIALLYFLYPIFLPFLLALVVAIIFDPLIIDLQRKMKIKRNASAIIILTILFVGVFAAIYFSISTVVTQTITFAKDVPSTVQTLIQHNDRINNFYNNLSPSSKDYIAKTTTIAKDKSTEFGSQLAGNLLGFFKKFPSYFVALIIFVISVYIISIELPRLKPKFLSIFDRDESRHKVEVALNQLKSSIVGFLKSLVILSLLTFIVALIGFMFLKVSYPFVMAIAIVLVDFIPILGSASIFIPWIIWCFVFGNVGTGIALFSLFVFISAFRRVLEPKLIGDSIGLSPLSTLISLYVGFELLGFIGMIIGPLIAIVLSSLKEANMINIKIKF